jgi:hypothetical protein
LFLLQLIFVVPELNAICYEIRKGERYAIALRECPAILSRALNILLVLVANSRPASFAAKMGGSEGEAVSPGAAGGHFLVTGKE